MMKTTCPYDPAFPCANRDDHKGMTKREFFALFLYGKIPTPDYEGGTEAVKAADRLIEALNDKPDDPVSCVCPLCAVHEAMRTTGALNDS